MPNDARPQQPADPDGELAELREKVHDYERWIASLDKQNLILENERRKLEAWLTQGLVAVVLVESDGKISWANNAYRDRFARDAPETATWLGRRCNQLFCAKAQPCDECPARAALNGGAARSHEMRLWIRDRYHYVWVLAMPICDDDGRARQSMLMLVDVTELELVRRSESAFRSSEQRFRAVFERVGAGMATLKIDGTLLQANSTFATMLGYTPAELMRRRLPELVHRDDAATVERALTELATDRPPQVSLIVRYRRCDGSDVAAESTAVLQLDPEDRPAYSVLMVHDLTQQRRADEEMERLRNDYEDLLQTVNGIVWEANPRTLQFSSVAGRAEAILGFPPERWIAQPRFWRNRLHPDDLDRVTRTFARGAESGERFEIEYRMFAADGRTVWIRDEVRVDAGADGSRMRGLMSDITENRITEQALAESRELLASGRDER